MSGDAVHRPTRLPADPVKGKASDHAGRCLLLRPQQVKAIINSKFGDTQMLNKIQEIETAARAKGPENDNALQAFTLAKVARIIVGKAEHTTDLSIECPGDAFDDILRLYTNGGGGNRLLEHMA